MTNEAQPRFDKGQIIRQESLAGIIRQRAKYGLTTGRRAFDLGFGEILEIADLFHKEIPDERRAILEQHSGSHLVLNAGPYRALSVRRMERETDLWVGLAIAGVQFAQTPRQQNA